MNAIKVLLADDHVLFRAGVHALLTNVEGIDVIGEADTGRLTGRQREVLQMVAKGYSSKEMAQILNLSPKTIETHRTQLMKQVDIHDVAGLVRYAVRTGLVSVDA